MQSQLFFIILHLALTTVSSFGNRHCGTRPFKHSFDAQHEEELARKMASTDDDAGIDFPVTIPVYFHVIRKFNGTTPKDGNLSDDVLKSQIDVLNRDYKQTGLFEFELAGVNRIEAKGNQSGWWKVAPDSPDSSEMKSSLRKGGSNALNLYTTQLTFGMLGFSSFPQDYAVDPWMDGVVLDFNTFPGMLKVPFNTGRTAVHEIGHWLGLYHTFQGGCSYPNDFVDDTAAQRTPTSGCPTEGDQTCTSKDFGSPSEFSTYAMFGSSNDPKNFMDYSSDSCLENFTNGQIERMRNQWALRV